MVIVVQKWIFDVEKGDISTMVGLGRSKICTNSQRLYARYLPSKNNIVAQKIWRGENSNERINRGLQRDEY